ncbi:MAG: hypothetical protein PHR15_06110 [Atopobiaceae bacterium]|jgi:hypothetical protein|nr:hypothetical protein [Atopobiaceae bacterium]MCH4180720.1 hypothetical protein [Atopobiaceae bacterium]MCH4215044.1 hypothetical protein [Atopobiaceae bacterium]MCH4230397.1 hypothetical protein [Atopobiaceae bacterium]MCH4277214.1 hypothetical protein [Atopobiaceae bacterium]
MFADLLTSAVAARTTPSRRGVKPARPSRPIAREELLSAATIREVARIEAESMGLDLTQRFLTA